MVSVTLTGQGQGGQSHARLITDLQRQTISTAFEEGHYVMGITIINDLCNSGYLPDQYVTTHRSMWTTRELTRLLSPLVRQLIYLSLYPYEPHKDSMDGNDLQRATFPTPAATEAANVLLGVLAERIPPSHLLAALPFYPTIGERPYTSPCRANSDISSISKMVENAELLAHCRSCWDILRQDFVPPLRVQRRTLPGSPTKRNGIESGSFSMTTAPIIGQESWFTLHWLLRLFERDAQETERVTGGAL